VSGLFARHVTAGPDEVRFQVPFRLSGWDTLTAPRSIPVTALHWSSSLTFCPYSLERQRPAVGVRISYAMAGAR